MRPGLAAISFAEEHGGVAYIARLLAAALEANYGSPWSLALDAREPTRVRRTEAARFASRLALGNALGRFDLLVFNHPGIARAQLLVPSPVRRPYVVQFHGTDVTEERIDAQHAAALRGAALRIAPSRFTAEGAMRTNPEIGPAVVCAHGLLPEQPVADTPDESVLARVGPHAALIVGRMWSRERRKGHDQLIEAWPSVLATVPDAQLVVAGTGDDLPRLRDKAQSLGLGEHILFTGYASEATLRALRKRCAIFAMPSRQEGFGLAYAEAMRDGLPCIGATKDAAEDVIVDGETGFLVEQQDRAEMVSALTRLLGDDDLRARFAAASRARYEAEYTFDRYSARLTTLLETVRSGLVRT